MRTSENGGRYMTAKEYLKQLKKLDVMINQEVKELEELRLKAMSIGSIDYSKGRTQTNSFKGAPFVELIKHIADLEAEINIDIEKLVDRKHKIIKQIQALDDTNYMEILYKRYVEFKKLEEIAVEMNFTYQYTREIHGYALQKFETTYKNLF